MLHHAPAWLPHSSCKQTYQACKQGLLRSTMAACRGVAALAASSGAGSSVVVLYSVGADCQVVALEAASGQQALKFRAGNHPLCAAAATPGAARRACLSLHLLRATMPCSLCLHPKSWTGIFQRCRLSISCDDGGQKLGVVRVQMGRACWWAAAAWRCGPWLSSGALPSSWATRCGCALHTLGPLCMPRQQLSGWCCL
jgi:hypothetical protein